MFKTGWSKKVSTCFKLSDEIFSELLVLLAGSLGGISIEELDYVLLKQKGLKRGAEKVYENQHLSNTKEFWHAKTLMWWQKSLASQ